MSAELDYSLSNTANVFSVTKTMWHREGIILPVAPTREEAQELCHMNYDLIKVPNFRKVEYDQEAFPNVEPDYVQTGGFTVVRTDTNAELGQVGQYYTPVPNDMAFRILDPLLDEGHLRLETGGVLREGRDAWLLGQWNFLSMAPYVQEVFHELGLAPFSVVIANHDGKRKLIVGRTSVRIVCANTQEMSIQEMTGRKTMVQIAHQGDVEQKLVEAAEEVFGDVVNRFEAVAKAYRALKRTTIDRLVFERLVLDTVAPDPRQNPKFNPESKLAEVVVDRADRKRAEITRLWTAGKGHTGDHSAWEALQGTYEALDHNEELWPNRGGSWRTLSSLAGTMKEQKELVMARLVRHADKLAISA